MIGKTKRYAITGGLLLLSAALVCTYLISRPLGHRSDAKITASQIIPHLQDGDVICRLGDRIWSSYIKNKSTTDRRFSHVGIVRIRNGEVTIINAECLVSEREERVNEVSLDDFLDVARAVGVYRANFLDGQIMSDGAMKYLGMPFDWKFDLNDTATVYCTELIHKVIMDKAPPKYALKTVRVWETGKPIIPLEAISGSIDFDEILYVETQ